SSDVCSSDLAAVEALPGNAHVRALLSRHIVPSENGEPARIELGVGAGLSVRYTETEFLKLLKANDLSLRASGGWWKLARDHHQRSASPETALSVGEVLCYWLAARTAVAACSGSTLSTETLLRQNFDAPGAGTATQVNRDNLVGQYDLLLTKLYGLAACAELPPVQRNGSATLDFNDATLETLVRSGLPL